MGVIKLATTSTFHQWRTHPIIHHSSTLSSSTSSLFNTSCTNLNHIKSCEFLKQSRTSLIRRAFNSSLDPFSEEEFAQKMQELTLKFDGSHHNSREEPWREMIQMSNIERKANSIDLPLSLRIIKRKLSLQMEEVRDPQSSSSAVKKAFSSMVFMIRELQSFTLHNMRELHTSILHRVRNEMQASFVWLFQQVFSTTPSLMVSVMILLANFTVYSISNNIPPPPPPPPTTTVSFEAQKLDSSTFSVTSFTRKLDSSMIKTFSVSFNGGDDGGSNIPAVKSGTEGEGSDQIRKQSQFCETSSTDSSDACVSRQQEEIRLWNSILEESEKGLLDHETMKNLISPVEAKLEVEDSSMDDFKMELLYQTGLFQEPENVLLLANYAQFLYLIVHDYDRAEKYFKRAAKAEPVDAETLNKYATFLWKARNDIWRAEETFLEAISVDPTNSVYAANYAHFLWNTGGDDACFPLDASSQQSTM